MKITSIQTSNFLGARAVDVRLVKPVAVFAGKNYAGKSSLQEAIRMALTGETVRVDLKKDYGALVTEGQESGFVEVTTPDATYSVVLPSGKGAHSDNPALPYVLDAQRFARLTADERRAFLFGLMGLSAGGPAVKERLTARGCDAAKIEASMPLLRAGFAAACDESKNKARDAKAAWRAVTGETYGAVKAAAWKTNKPMVNEADLKQAREDLVAIDAGLETETAKLGAMQGAATAAADSAGRLDDLRKKAGRYAGIQDKLNKDEAELKQWQERVAETKAKASGAANALRPNRYSPECGAALLWGNGTLMPYAKQPVDQEARANLPEYERALKLMETSVANGRRDLAAADAAAVALREIESAAGEAAPSDEEIAAQRQRVDTIKHGRGNQQAAIRLLEDAQRAAAEADKKTADAARHHADVEAWTKIADALAPDGIPGELLTEALGPINERLHSNAGMAEWEQVVIHSDMRITYGLRNFALISESEKWRTDAMIAEAVSHLAGVKLLVLDRFDVLDLKGREDLLFWLDGMAQDGDIETALIFGTLKAVPALNFAAVEAHWIENGAVGQIREAA